MRNLTEPPSLKNSVTSWTQSTSKAPSGKQHSGKFDRLIQEIHDFKDVQLNIIEMIENDRIKNSSNVADAI